MYSGKVPEITRFDIYDSKEDVKNKMIEELNEKIAEYDELDRKYKENVETWEEYAERTE